MASFIEDALLRVTDQSSKPIRKIDRELKKLFRTARGGKKIPVKFDGLTKANSDVKRLAASLRTLPRSKTIKMNFTGATAARKSLTTGAATNVRFRFSGATAARTALNAQMAKTPVMVPFKFSNIPAAKAQLQARLGTVNVRVNPTGGGRGGSGPRNPRQPATPTPVGFWANLRREFTPNRAGRTSGRATVFDLQGEAYIAVRSLIINAGTATLAAQTTTTEQNLTLSQDDIPIVNALSRKLVQEVEGMSLTNVRGTVSDLAKSIDTSTPAFEQIARSLILGIERSRLIDPAAADRNELNLVKILELAQISENPERAADLVDAFVKGQAAAGKTFNAASAVKALRTSGLATTLDGEGLFRFLLQFDEQARQLGSGLGRFVKVLNSDNGVSDEQRAKLIDAGLVDRETGRAVQPDLLLQNPGAWIEAVVVPLLKEQGVDVSNANDIQAALNDLGFVTQEFRLVANEIAGLTERANAARSQAAAGLTSAQDASSVDLGASIANLATSMDTLASESLVPLFETLAPGVDTVANFIEAIAIGEEPIDDLKRLGLAAGVAATAFVGFKAGGTILSALNPFKLAASALTGSATLLDGAALAIQRAALGGRVGGFNGKIGPVPPGQMAGGTGPRLGPNRGGATMLGFGTVGLLMLDAESTKASFKAAGEGLADVIDAKLPKTLANVLNADRRAKEERDKVVAEAEARGATVTELPDSPIKRWLDGLRGFSTPPEIVITEAELKVPFTSTDPAKVERLIEVMARNAEKIKDPDRSPASVASLIAQQQVNAEKLAVLGVEDAGLIAQAFADGATTGQQALDMAFGTGAEALDMSFATGTEKVTAGMDDAALRFGPLAGDGMLTVADEFGRRVGQQAALAFGALNVNVTQPAAKTAPAITGAQTPF